MSSCLSVSNFPTVIENRDSNLRFGSTMAERGAPQQNSSACSGGIFSRIWRAITGQTAADFGNGEETTRSKVGDYSPTPKRPEKRSEPIDIPYKSAEHSEAVREARREHREYIMEMKRPMRRRRETRDEEQQARAEEEQA